MTNAVKCAKTREMTKYIIYHIFARAKYCEKREDQSIFVHEDTNYDE